MTLQEKLDQATKSIQQNQQQAQHHANQVLMLQGYIARLQEEIEEQQIAVDGQPKPAEVSP